MTPTPEQEQAWIATYKVEQSRSDTGQAQWNAVLDYIRVQQVRYRSGAITLDVGRALAHGMISQRHGYLYLIGGGWKCWFCGLNNEPIVFVGLLPLTRRRCEYCEASRRQPR